jgi:hypothetical protein
MLETILSQQGESFTLINALSVILSSIVLGLVISYSYMKTNKNHNSSFVTTLVMLPVIIAIIILLVGNSIATAFSLAGAFSIIRFRSAPGEPKDIAYVFFTLAIGLTCGLGYIVYGFIFTAILCLLMFIVNIANFGESKHKNMQLKITIPEDLNYDGAFEDIFNRYTNSWQIQKVRTRDFGALFELNYMICMKNESDQKKFIDELRTRNGNLNITLTLAGFNE